MGGQSRLMQVAVISPESNPLKMDSRRLLCWIEKNETPIFLSQEEIFRITVGLTFFLQRLPYCDVSCNQQAHMRRTYDLGLVAKVPQGDLFELLLMGLMGRGLFFNLNL